MALGYIEQNYTVLEECAHPARDNPKNRRHYELRQATNSNESPYIAVFTKDPMGVLVADILLRYTSEDVAAQDWAKLTSPEVVSLTDLNYLEIILNHHVGYTRDGGVAMY